MDVVAANRVWVGLLTMCRNERLQVAVRSSGKGAVIAGAGAFVGGLALGPVGMALGGLVGGIVGAKASNVESIVSILQEMPQSQREQIIRGIMQELGNGYTLDLLASLLITSPEIKQIAVSVLRSVLQSRGLELKF